MAPTGSRTVTVDLRTLAAALLALLALLGAYLLGGAGREPAAATSTAAPTLPGSVAGGAIPGTLTMSGRGEATGVPDELTFALAVTRTRADVDAAMDATSGTTARVLAALEDAGVARKDVQSTGLSVDPVYRYPAYAEPVLVGYRVRQSASVVVRDLADAGRALGTATEVGGDAVRLSGLGLRIGDRDALLERARTDALETATAKAEQYAAATGQRLGRVLTLTEGGDAVEPRRAQLRDAELARSFVAADRAAKAVPVRAGREDLGVTVSVVWQLLPAV